MCWRKMLKWNLKATISGMSVGDSFFIPCLECDRVQSKALELGRDFGYKLSTRKVVEDLVKGVRVWRVA
jgi:hypothetical protein